MNGLHLLHVGASEGSHNHDLFLGAEDIITDVQSKKIMVELVEQFKRQKFINLNYNNCFSAVEENNPSMMQLCSTFDAQATAPRGIVNILLEMPRKGGPIDVGWSLVKEWRSGLLPILAEVAQTRVECPWCASHQYNHQHGQGVIFFLKIIPWSNLRKIVQYMVDVDQKTYEMKVAADELVKELTSAIDKRKEKSVLRENKAKKLANRLLLRTSLEQREYERFIHETGKDFKRRLACL